MFKKFFLEIRKDGNMVACREKTKKESGVECEKITDVTDLFDFID